MEKFKTLKGFAFTLFVITGILLLTGCANSEVVTACLKGHTYGFWGGLLHGIIAPIDLIAMLFTDDITVFAQNNNGAWYAFGFILGSGGWGFMGGHGASRGRKK